MADNHPLFLQIFIQVRPTNITKLKGITQGINNTRVILSISSQLDL